MKRWIFIWIFLFSILPSGFSQQSISSGTSASFGIFGGLYFEIGSHIQAVGLQIKAYGTYEFGQINIGQTFKYNLGSYGKRRNFLESRSALGALLLWGKRNQNIDFLLDGLNHQTGYNYGVAYNYLIYKDNIGTSQLSGGWALHLKKVSLYFENDVFGGQSKDRFRSGNFVISYRDSNFRIHSGVYIWTGETRESIWDKTPRTGAPYGIRDLSALPYGKTSHGIAYGSLILNTQFGNQVHYKLGLDSEQIRHFVQNRVSHDLFFLPKKLERNTPHYPRLDSNGKAIFTKELRRPDRFYFQNSLNGNFLE